MLEPMSMQAQRATGVPADLVMIAAMDLAAPAILVRDLHKSYGAVQAVRGIDFDVARGEVFGLLGPNGAGKTTTVEILEGYRERTSGIVSVLGHDPGGRPRALRERVGIVLQDSGIYRHVTVRELVTHWAGFYPAPRDVDEVIDLAACASPPTSAPAACPAARRAGWTSRSRSSATPSSSSSTSRRPASTRLRAGPRGRRFARSPISARPSCSRRTTSTRRRRSATASRSSRTGGSSRSAPRRSSASARRRATA